MMATRHHPSLLFCTQAYFMSPQSSLRQPMEDENAAFRSMEKQQRSRQRRCHPCSSPLLPRTTVVAFVVVPTTLMVLLVLSTTRPLSDRHVGTVGVVVVHAFPILHFRAAAMTSSPASGRRGGRFSSSLQEHHQHRHRRVGGNRPVVKTIPPSHLPRCGFRLSDFDPRQSPPWRGTFCFVNGGGARSAEGGEEDGVGDRMNSTEEGSTRDGSTTGRWQQQQVQHMDVDVAVTPLDYDDDELRQRIQRLLLSEVLDELRCRQVRFHPGAGRYELEQMLLLAWKRDNDGGGRAVEGRSAGVAIPAAPESRHPPSVVAIDEMAAALPSRSVDDDAEAEAEALSVPDVRAANAAAIVNDDTSSESEVERMSLTELLVELRSHGIRFSPTSTRRELERLLLVQLVEHPEETATSESGDFSGAADDVDRADGAWPSASTQRSQRPTHPVDSGRRGYDAEDRPRRRSKRRPRSDASSSASSWDWSSIVPGTVLEDAVGAARRTVRSVKRKAADLWSIDEDGIRDADFTYLYRDEDLYGRVRWFYEPMMNVRPTTNKQDYYDGEIANDDSFPIRGGGDRESDTFDRRPVRLRSNSYRSVARGERRRRSSPDPVAPGQRQERHDPRPRVRRTSNSTSNGHGPDQYDPSRQRFDDETTRQRHRRSPIRQGVYTKRPYLLPPARESQPMPSNATASSTFPPASPKVQSERKIYSPYNDRDRFDEVGDGLDRFGKFVADVADRFMWGPNEDGSDRSDAATGSAEDPSAVDPTTESSNGSPSRGTYRHWKDRLEAQFDSVLGIGEEGEYYRRWADKARRDKRNEGGHDPFSVARGVQPKRRGLSSPHVRNRRYDKPIWEEEGNLVSLLFGRTQSGSSLLFEKLLDPNHGSLLFLLRAVFRSFLLVSSYVCRWASVRGAFPQPIVVIGVFSAAVCAPQRRRLWAVGLALIFFRALGELAHGYAYGNDGWEDDAPDAEEDNVDDNGR